MYSYVHDMCNICQGTYGYMDLNAKHAATCNCFKLLMFRFWLSISGECCREEGMEHIRHVEPREAGPSTSMCIYTYCRDTVWCMPHLTESYRLMDASHMA